MSIIRHANEQDIDGPLIRFHIIDQLGVCI